MKISGCVALVTGGASGIGRGRCEVLLQRNAKVFISTLDSRQRVLICGGIENFMSLLKA